jgi:hypothetical protein
MPAKLKSGHKIGGTRAAIPAQGCLASGRGAEELFNACNFMA